MASFEACGVLIATGLKWSFGALEVCCFTGSFGFPSFSFFYFDGAGLSYLDGAGVDAFFCLLVEVL